MNKSTKGALAAAGVGAILLGGAGSLAYWNDSTAIPAGSLNSGHLKLTAGPCGEWSLDGTTTTSFDPAKDTLVPGDTISRTCTFDVSAVGKHITATFTAAAPNVSGPTGYSDFAHTLTPTVTYVADGSGGGSGDGQSAIALAQGESTVTATVSLVFETGAANLTEDETATLDEIAITATQGHQG